MRMWLRSAVSFSSRSHTHTFNGPLSGTTRVSQYQKGKTNLDFTEARDSEWQWHQLGHMQVCTSLQTDNHASTPLLSFFYRPDVAQPTASKHWSTLVHVHFAVIYCWFVVIIRTFSDNESAVCVVCWLKLLLGPIQYTVYSDKFTCMTC